ncbi:lymphotoxin-alpha-like [Leucoraja erinacea]|uniref:lymphotoxin-alpha-like n=1 Tax=Leucoraja erinaceus TaxID=7782 RepID=UPI0024542610|nr:lymphotoxin-alpha-like [Leucoraja erinacea]
MSSERMLAEAESGREGAERRRGCSGAVQCLFRLACVVVALGSAAAASYVLLSKSAHSNPGQAGWEAVVAERGNKPQETGNEGGCIEDNLCSQNKFTNVNLSQTASLFPLLVPAAFATGNTYSLIHFLYPPTADPNRGISKLVWQDDVGIAFSYGIEFSNNSLLIQKPGLYFVYTQVVFYARQCEGRTVFLSHDIHKFSPAYPVETILLKATKSVCHNHQHSDLWFKTSYQGAIFEMEAGDRIFSRVPKGVVRYLDTKEGKTFFGAFAL